MAVALFSDRNTARFFFHNVYLCRFFLLNVNRCKDDSLYCGATGVFRLSRKLWPTAPGWKMLYWLYPLARMRLTSTRATLIPFLPCPPTPSPCYTCMQLTHQTWYLSPVYRRNFTDRENNTEVIRVHK